MMKAIKEGLVTAPSVGRNKVEISLLQYADDTIFAVKGTADNARAVNWLLKFFEVISGLSINFDKSTVFGVNVGDEEFDEWARILGCRVGTWPMSYLGLRVGGRVNGTEAWKGVVDKVRGRLRRWEARSLSMRGRLTIIKSVLFAIPIYTLSFLRLTRKVESQLKSLMNQFLWGANEGEKRVTWVGWDKVCKSEKEGGLGVKNLGRLNKALLSKWVWKFLRDRDCLWVRVVNSRFGDLERNSSGTVVENTGRKRVGWWKKVVEVVEDGNMVPTSAGDYKPDDDDNFDEYLEGMFP
ncbi:hypothetical protein OROHE_004720 [Orobanche hederae]